MYLATKRIWTFIILNYFVANFYFTVLWFWRLTSFLLYMYKRIISKLNTNYIDTYFCKICVQMHVAIMNKYASILYTLTCISTHHCLFNWCKSLSLILDIEDVNIAFKITPMHRPKTSIYKSSKRSFGRILWIMVICFVWCRLSRRIR